MTKGDGRQVEMEEEDEEEIGEGLVKCEVCGAQADIDINNIESMYEWISEHIFGHSGQVDKKETNTKS